MLSRFVTNLRIAALSLLQHGRRSAFLAVAITGVTALLVLLGALSNGVHETMMRAATTLSTGHVNVGGFFKITAGQAGAVVTKYEQVLDVVKKNLPEMDYTVERGRGWAKVISDTGSMQAGIGGVDVANEPGFKRVLQITAGNLDDLAQPNTMLVFEGQLPKLGVKVGDAVTISAQTTRGTANTIDCRVVAVARDVGLMSKWNVFIPIATLRDLYQMRSDATGAIHILLKDKFVPQATSIAARLRGTLESNGYRVMDPVSSPFWQKFQTVIREDWTGQKLDVTTWEDELSFLTWTLTLLDVLSFVLLTILVAIVITGIMNTMWIAIRERTREIGTLRAIGMQRGGVLSMFLLESLLLGLAGTIVGAALGIGVAALINAASIKVPLSVQLFLMSDHVHMTVLPASVIRGIILITVVTGLAALYPSFRAARLRPVEAMSHF